MLTYCTSLGSRSGNTSHGGGDDRQRDLHRFRIFMYHAADQPMTCSMGLRLPSFSAFSKTRRDGERLKHMPFCIIGPSVVQKPVVGALRNRTLSCSSFVVQKLLFGTSENYICGQRNKKQKIVTLVIPVSWLEGLYRRSKFTKGPIFRLVHRKTVNTANTVFMAQGCRSLLLKGNEIGGWMKT